MATTAYGWDSFYSTTLSSAITSTDTVIPVVSPPTAQEGVLVLEPDSASTREIIYYTSVSGSSVICPSVGAGRGQEGTSASAHGSGSIVKRNTTSRDFEVLQDGTAIATEAITNTKIASGAVSYDKLSTTLLQGWFGTANTWTYASSTTFTVTGDVTAQFPVGTKIMLTQTTIKYFYVTASSYSAPNTTVTITGGSDYSLANAAITSPALSYDASPQSFPQWFNYTPTLTNMSGGSQTYSKFRMVGKEVRFRFLYTLAGAGISGAVSFTLPVTASSNYVALDPIGTAALVDAGSASYGGRVLIGSTTTAQVRAENAAGTYTVLTALSSTVPFTYGNTDTVACEGSYETA